MGIKYLTFIDAISGYHNLKLHEMSYLTTFSCPFGRYRYITLHFGAAPAGDVFQKKMNKLFSSMVNVFSIAYDILVAGFDEQDKAHDEPLDKVLGICRQASLKLNKDNCLFKCSNIPFFGKVISWHCVSPDSRKLQALTEILSPKSRKELQSFLGIINYLRKFSPATAKVCKALQKLTSVKADWT